ncbi:MAG TPA: TetR/AcrR family transcriptional regulator [Luteimicrobium sp.]|nr:TetR/AcrR family transcriptional regulator [Luteimicrobium sp.]
MPRITAPTVPEHRAAQRRAVLEAARALLVDDPGTEPTFGAIAERAGLARSSVYHYFGSRDELFLAVALDELPRWQRSVGDAMAAAPDAPARVLAYAAANIDLVASGDHAVVDALAAFSPRAFTDPQVAAMHRALAEPLVEALGECGLDDAPLLAELVDAVVHRASRAVTRGHDVDHVQERVRALLRPALRG